MQPPAQYARIFFFLPEFFSFCGAGLRMGCVQEPTPGSTAFLRMKTLSKNRPLVTRPNIAGSWASGGRGGFANMLRLQEMHRLGVPGGAWHMRNAIALRCGR